MVNGERHAAFELFVAIVSRLAAQHGLRRKLTKRSSQADVTKAYKKLVLKVHPDKGGNPDEFKELQAAKDAFDLTGNAKGGRPAADGGRPTSARPPPPKRPAEPTAETNDVAAASRTLSVPCVLPCEHCGGHVGGVRVECTACMFTYNGLTSLGDWDLFVAAYMLMLSGWGVLYHLATLERCLNGKFHVHLMLQFRMKVNKRSTEFYIASWKPNVRPAWGNLMGETMASKRNPQPGYDRGFFYVWADKIGTARDANDEVCVHGNYFPVWEEGARYKYAVKAVWADTLWRSRKLSHETYREYLIKCREDVSRRLRNLDVVMEQEKAERINEERRKVIKRIRAGFQPFKEYQVLMQWRALFELERDRYPILIVLGASNKGKTELIKSLFQNPCQLQIRENIDFPDAFRKFDRDTHDALILDDVRDCKFFVSKQDVFQSKYDAVHEFGSTNSGQYAYSQWLFQVPVAATINYTTTNRHLLVECDYLGKERNRVLFELTESPFKEENVDGQAAAVVAIV